MWRLAILQSTRMTGPMGERELIGQLEGKRAELILVNDGNRSAENNKER